MQSDDREWDEDLLWSLSDQIGRTYSAIARLGAEVNTSSPVSDPELVALIVLDAFPDGLTQTEWGKYQAVSRQRTHVLARRLGDAGMVNAVPHGRSVIVTLTDSGKALVAENRRALTKKMAALLNGLPPGDGRQMLDLLRNLSTALESGAPDSKT